jgi:two-component system, LytTR family, response regulator
MSDRIRTLVVDDEPVARARVLSLLRTETDVEVVGECATGSQALCAIQEKTPDLVFLDIQMPEIDGVALARSCSGGKPAIVFVTAYDTYALCAFEVHAVDYLLKPFSAERFRSALTHVRQQLPRRQATAGGPRPDPPAGHRPAAPWPERHTRLIVKSSGRIHFVRIQDIDWCEAAGNYVCLHVGPQTHLVRGTMSHIESQLGAGQFVRVHRSTIVNVDRIQELRSSFNGEYVIVLHDQTRLTLSRGYRQALQARLGKSL